MQHSTPYTPQQNGVAKRKNRSLKDMATCMIEERDISPKIWVETISCDAHIQNISFHKSVLISNWADPGLLYHTNKTPSSLDLSATDRRAA